VSIPGRLASIFYNLHWVTPEIARSAQAYAGGWEAMLRSHGIRSVLNLRGSNPKSGWYKRERRSAGRLGVDYRDLALNSRRLPPRDVLLAILDSADAMPAPLLLKCSGGADRTSLAAGLLILHRQGYGALENARRQTDFWPFLHWPRRQQRWIRAFFDHYAEDAGGLTLREWLVMRYMPTRFAEYLRAHGLGDAYAAARN